MQKDEIILILTLLLKHDLREALVQELLVCSKHLQVTLSLSPPSLSIKGNRQKLYYFTVRLTVRVDPSLLQDALESFKTMFKIN